MTDGPRASGQQDRPGEEDNPFAPPPEGRPDQPWRPRNPDGNGNGDSDGGNDGNQRQRWGSQWSRKQPGRGSGPFGAPGNGGPDGSGENGGRPGRRWDPNDPGQRHARYSVLAGMWGVFAGLLAWEWLGLLLGALALYWGISALRGGPSESAEGRDRSRERAKVTAGAGQPAPPDAPAPGGTPPTPPRPQRGVAIAGVVMAGLSLLIVATAYTAQLVYKDYFDCVSDSLTAPSKAACEDRLPSQLRPIFGQDD
ncbi:hypothetical protein [Streptomyces sp. NBRC 109706]|uniref:hypothetical protein n=1 Tax=Streptomyces sp. NBRC 109706 TaxID=1550035 RepID=UPI000781A476|nr:hypothetical protein [Streptomyces sp. NBRC 109706]